MRRLLSLLAIASVTAMPVVGSAQTPMKKMMQPAPHPQLQSPTESGDAGSGIDAVVDVDDDLLAPPGMVDDMPPPPPDDLLAPPPPMEGEMPPPSAMQPPIGQMQQPPAPPKKPDPKKMEEIKQRILQFKYDRMRKAVAIDSETWQRFFAIYKPAEAEMDGIAKEINQEMRKLHDMIDGAKSDGDVDPEMDKIRALRHKLEDRVMKLNDDLKSVLSPRQRARLLMFEHEFNTRLREQIMQRRRPALREKVTPKQRQRLRQWWMNGHPDDAPPPPPPPPNGR